ncbi:sugar kinase [Rothia halotolerans]|uniref:sugar kinase n=1 Tax=Rothia halotolerans TaxID=405770 RepID=UPI0013EDE614|nr:sugar kinase [Rothia halotolerans]
MPHAVCLGETMAVMSPRDPRDESVRLLSCTAGGAESNVAAGLEAAGIPTSWISRLGEDPLGDLILEELGAAGVDAGAVVRDPERRTGLYLKSRRGEAGKSEVFYYREGSAASAMSSGLLEEPEAARRLAEADLVHTSGITASLSPGCSELLEALFSRPRSARLSFDVNYRPSLPRVSPPELLGLARRADVVFVGADEARAAWGAEGVDAVLAALPDVPCVVVKDDSRRALCRLDGELSEAPSLSVRVVDAVGAGDAFAAGFLAGLLRGDDAVRCLRRGHLHASAALTTTADRALPPSEATLDALLAVTEDEWESIRVDESGAHRGGRL